MANLSVLIPARNSEEFLITCLNSVLNQIDKADEVIVIENNSLDNTRELLDQFCYEHLQLKVISTDSTVSLFESRKLAIESAKNEYLIFLDSDDLLMNNCISTLKEIINNFQDPDLIIYRTMFFNEDGDIGPSKLLFKTNEPKALSNEEKEKLNKIFLTSDIVNNVWIKCVKKKLIIDDYRNFGLFSNYTYCEDKINSSIFFNRAESVIYIPEILHKYRNHKKALTKKVSSQWIEESLYEVNYFQKFILNNVKFSKYKNESLKFFKKQYTRLVVWFIGQNRIKVHEIKNNLIRFNCLMEKCSINYDKICCKEPKYEFFYQFLKSRNALILKIVCTLYIKSKGKW